MHKKNLFITIVTLFIVSFLIGIFGCSNINYESTGQSIDYQFDGERAIADVKYQQKLGPRTPGSSGHQQIIEWIEKTLKQNDCNVDKQVDNISGLKITNIIGKKGIGDEPFIILGAHYDTRIYADNDPDITQRTKPVPGANDGGSGVAILLELSRILQKDYDGMVWFVFFDAEDNGGINDYHWSMGSESFVNNYLSKSKYKPTAVIIVDMVGDSDLGIYYEKNSNPNISEEIWRHASALGYSNNFIPKQKYQMIDDHIPFIEKGYPAVDIIDFDYPYWHTIQDTIDKLSPQSLEIVGQTLLSYILELSE